MSEKYLPPDVPTVYRGGTNLAFEPFEVKIDRETGQVKTTHGISVDADPSNVAKFGGAFRVVAIPTELTIAQRGKRESHFEIVPQRPMTPERFQTLLAQIELEPSDHD